jgi:hypothetical protein
MSVLVLFWSVHLVAVAVVEATTMVRSSSNNSEHWNNKQSNIDDQYGTELQNKNCSTRHRLLDARRVYTGGAQVGVDVV